MMYFSDREQAGRKLAKLLKRYRRTSGVVMALSPGAVIIGEVIAKKINFGLTMLLMKDIVLPGETSVLGTINQSGGFVYNDMFSVGEIEEFAGEFHNYIEAEKINKIHEINHILGKHGLIDRKQLDGNVILLVSDGAKSGVVFDAAVEYLKPVAFSRLVVAAPIVSVPALDRLHILADEIHILSVADNYLDTNHYYDNNDMPDNDKLLERLDSKLVG